MGSNPQILYTPQQQMGYGGYSVPCRVGNWAEDEYLGVLLTQSHLGKQGEGMLASQQLNGTLGAALAPATLSPAPADGAIKYGDVVMISSAEGGVVAIDTTARVELPQEAYTVTRTRPEVGVACTRTAWTIEPPPGQTPPEGSAVLCGVPFVLSAVGGSGAKVYLQSQRYTLHNQNVALSAGMRKQGCCAVPAPSADTLWQVRVLDPTDLGQMEADGLKAVPANTFVSLTHVNTMTPLHTGPTLIKNKYGGELEMSVFLDASPLKSTFGVRNGKMLNAGNHFAFTTAE